MTVPTKRKNTGILLRNIPARRCQKILSVLTLPWFLLDLGLDLEDLRRHEGDLVGRLLEVVAAAAAAVEAKRLLRDLGLDFFRRRDDRFKQQLRRRKFLFLQPKKSKLDASAVSYTVLWYTD